MNNASLILTLVAIAVMPHYETRAADPAQDGQITTAGPVPDAVTLHVTFRPMTRRVESKAKGKRTAVARLITKWDGSLSVTGGRLQQLKLWRNDPRDSVDGASWKMQTHRAIPRSSRHRKLGYEKMRVKDALLLAQLTDTNPDTQLSFKTANGDFNFALKQVPMGGQKGFLKGKVVVTHAATSTTILSAPTEDDQPSAALGPDGKLYVAYIAFTHGKDFRRRTRIEKMPDDFSDLEQPVGGDQVMLMVLDGEKWIGPMPLTPTGQDVYRTALAVDGHGRAWVFWSANVKGNWDIYARFLEGDRLSPTLRLTTTPGPDTFPAATTDSQGRAWVTWQGFRKNDANISAARQEGKVFGKPMTVSAETGNEWAPSIAASKKGQVAIAWDTYRHGNYDVYCRVWDGATFDEPMPIAASLRCEMRPTVAYDAEGRLWVAYEDGMEKWGKDQGDQEKGGTGLYWGRTVGVRVWADSQLWQPMEHSVCATNPWLRTKTGHKPPPRRIRLSAPRLAADASGRLWLAIRSSHMGERVGVGATWYEHVTWYDGARWANAILCPGTDNVLDNRPALVAMPGHGLRLIASADGRGALGGTLPRWLIRQLAKKGERIQQKGYRPKWPDPVNNELTLCHIRASAAPAKPELKPVEPLTPASAPPTVAKERADVARCRAARATVRGKEVRLFRGEFHRHTEISSDGGGDGMLIDMWRYALDAIDFDWIGNGDHDNGGGRDYSWWITQKTTDLFCTPELFVPMFTYERSCGYPDGHRNVVFARRGIRTLPRLVGGKGKPMDELPASQRRPSSPDTQMLYKYLHFFDGICAEHTSGTDMGTDWRDNDPKVEPIVEIYQGARQNYEMPGAPRSNTPEDSVGGWRPLGFVSRALLQGFRLGFQASSDHGSTHISYCNVWVEEPTREAIFTAMKRRHIYGATDNIIAEFHCGNHFMGDEFETKEKPVFRVKIVGTEPLARVHVVKDNTYVYTVQPNRREVEFQWRDSHPTPGKTSYYYVRGEQTDGELVWISPMWVTFKAE